MVRVTVKFEGEACTLRAEGHATGSVEMCAAVSGLLYALAGYLLNARDSGLARQEEHHMGGGDVSLRYSGDAWVRAAYEMAYIGLKQLENAGPEYVAVELSEAN